MRFKLALFFLFFCFICNSFSQEQLGVRLENYAGVNSLSLNPASNLSGAFDWDVNLIGAGVFGQTNYGILYQTNLNQIFQKLPEVSAAHDFSSEHQFPENSIIYDYNDNDRKKYGTLNAIVMGPSFMIKLESGHSFGLFTNLRTVLSAQQIPRELNYYFFDRTPLGEEFNIQPFTSAGMSWSEIGLNYARRIATSEGNIDFGASIKFLNGYEAFYFNNEKNFGLTQLPGDTMSFASPHFTYGLTTSNATGEDINLSKNGSGIAFDLGAVYTIDGFTDTYQWKFGAALLDIGKINFTKNAQQHEINTDQSFLIPSRDYNSTEDVDEIFELLSDQSLGNPTESLQERSFGIWLPGALSLQADYNFGNNVYLNATMIQRVPFQNNAIKRGNLLAFTPRFEHRWFSAAVPLSLYNYSKVNAGLSLRLGLLTIGSENLGSFFGDRNFTGSDIYFALKINPFNSNLNLGGRGSKRGKGVKCYEF